MATPHVDQAPRNMRPHASANKGGRRDMDEQTFGTHVPPEQMGFVFKITSAEMCAKSQR